MGLATLASADPRLLMTPPSSPKYAAASTPPVGGSPVGLSNDTLHVLSPKGKRSAEDAPNVYEFDQLCLMTPPKKARNSADPAATDDCSPAKEFVQSSLVKTASDNPFLSPERTPIANSQPFGLQSPATYLGVDAKRRILTQQEIITRSTTYAKTRYSEHMRTYMDMRSAEARTRLQDQKGWRLIKAIQAQLKLHILPRVKAGIADHKNAAGEDCLTYDFTQANAQLPGLDMPESWRYIAAYDGPLDAGLHIFNAPKLDTIESPSQSSLAEHTIAKHVGKDEAFLLNRLATEARIKQATSFTNLAIAQCAVDLTFFTKMSQLRLMNFMNHKTGPGQPLFLYSPPFEETLGFGISKKDATSNPVRHSDLRVACVVVVKTQDTKPGYTVLTAMPIAESQIDENRAAEFLRPGNANSMRYLRELSLPDAQSIHRSLSNVAEDSSERSSISGDDHS